MSRVTVRRATGATGHQRRGPPLAAACPPPDPIP